MSQVTPVFSSQLQCRRVFPPILTHYLCKQYKAKRHTLVTESPWLRVKQYQHTISTRADSEASRYAQPEICETRGVSLLDKAREGLPDVSPSRKSVIYQRFLSICSYCVCWDLLMSIVLSMLSSIDIHHSTQPYLNKHLLTQHTTVSEIPIGCLNPHNGLNIEAMRPMQHLH